MSSTDRCTRRPQYSSDCISYRQLCKLDQRNIDAELNIGLSEQIDTKFVTVVRARMTTVQDAGITWIIMANAGAAWQVCTSSSGWHYVTSVPVLVEDFYAVVIPTLTDSTSRTSSISGSIAPPTPVLYRHPETW